jgi:hypothetical protein
MPTNKNLQIENLLTGISGISRQDANAQGICTWCKMPIDKPFRDELSKKEYHISGFCQKCQDDTFGIID